MFICWGWRKGNHSTRHHRHPAAMPDCGICGTPAAGTSKVENKELQFHKCHWFVNRRDGFSELETKYLRKKPFEWKELIQRFALGAMLPTQC